ncbi:MAG: low affinity iron permease family protein [Phenylobacterium sp.]|uniref:low affinity iron permease family protein n=1 Tax=Phenylobacterium sp. TaxID=1871053 RepID=UPI00391D362B
MNSFAKNFTRFATVISRWAGRPYVFATCCVLVVAWALSGPVFGFSDTWQLVINTSTTIITFLMVFLIQNTQNRDNNAIQAKLDELIRVGRAHNSFIGIENLGDEELEQILAECDRHGTRLREEARKQGGRGAAAARAAAPRKGQGSGGAKPPARRKSNKAKAAS